MRLFELFKTEPDNLQWEYKKADEASAVFTVGGEQYKFIAYNLHPRTGKWEVEFSRVRNNKRNYELTGSGNSVSVMSAITVLMRELFETYDINVIIFFAKEQSRRSLYARMISRILPDWELKDIKNDGTFSLTRPVHTSLNETAEEDRAMISLASAIYSKLKDEHIGYEPDYTDPELETVSLGKIKDIVDTPITALNNVSIDLQGGEEFQRRADSIPSVDKVKAADKIVLAFWEPNTMSLVLNLDYLTSDRLRTTITHELRHALDEIKSGSYPASPKNKTPDVTQKYFTPKKKEHRKKDPYSTLRYRAQPAEINARFIEVLDELSVRIPNLVKRFGDETFDAAMTTVGNLFNQYEIADIFPEKEASKDYKQLFKRAAEFAKKEIAHVQQSMGIENKPKRPNLPK